VASASSTVAVSPTISDHGHPDTFPNDQRCLRLFEKWESPNRVDTPLCRPPSRDDWAKEVIAGLDDPRQSDAGGGELIAPIDR
jgi:hypothetical protein